ncbi:MAG: 4-alpha-glucanotransferase [Nitrospirae bacterium]|nr:4-alpha-glucanotransferase [Nitrospirota bacterium]
MSIHEELINELADLCGIIPEYWDIFGNKHITPIETKKAILKAMKLNIDSDEDIKNEMYAQKARPWNRFVEPVKIVSVNDQPLTIPVYIPANEGEESRLSLSWTIKNESGQKDEFVLSGDNLTISDQQWIDGIRYIKIDLVSTPPSPSLGKGGMGGYPIGYYSIDMTFKIPHMEISGTSRLIITPDSCYIPQELKNGKTWGLSINLYSIRSSQNWGAGDFDELKKIVKWISELKGGFVGINPLHAIPNKKPFGISPYSPVSRLYKNFIYLDIEDIPEVKELLTPPSPPLSKGGMGEYSTNQTIGIETQIDELRKENLIDYERVASLKISVLRNAFEIFYEEHYLKDSTRCKAFRKYISEEGNNLESFATYMALSEEFGEGWQEWTEEYRTPSSHTVQEFKKTNEKEILFYQYVQWLIDGQLKEAAEQTRDLGMPVGIYHDLAIGSIGGGSDAWNFQDVIADGISLGAPPDDFNPTGQNWGFPPLIPEKLKESGYELFIQTIRKNMKHFGALRIDHALGMFRQFWIPQGMPASQGAYVRYPAEDILRIIALESVRNRTMVIAEDLGTIGENVRESLFRFRMLSYRLLYFERNYPDPSFLSPERYPDMALCAVTTHDLPTLYGWWIGRDIDLKKRLGIYSGEDALQRDIENRERDKTLLLNALQSQGLLKLNSKLQTPNSVTHELCLAIYEYLARTSCRLVAVSLDDAIGMLDQQNMPGITDSYPSWMQKTPIPLEQMLSDKWFSALSEMFKKNNR